jgi:hypothetical protein
MHRVVADVCSNIDHGRSGLHQPIEQPMDAQIARDDG